MPNFCAAPNCTRKSTQSDLAFFRFPRDPSRCEKWVENCRRYDLEDKTPDQLNKHYRLCAQHFEDSMICRSSPYRTVLRENAIPTIFDLTSHLGNPGRRRKRIKELSEEEIRTLKERKRTEMVFGLHHSFLMASKSFLDIELLIALVRLHPELYDPLHSSYYDATRRATIWNQIASEIFMDWEDLNPQQRAMKAREVQTQWQSLKENFRHELSKQMRQEFSPLQAEKPTFSHFKELLFLQPLMVVDENAVQPPTAASRTDEGVDVNAVQPLIVARWIDERVYENAVCPLTAAKRTDYEENVQIIYIKEELPSPPRFTESEDDGPTDVISRQHLQESHSIKQLRVKWEEEELRIKGEEEELRIEGEEEEERRIKGEEEELRMEGEEEERRIEGEEEEERRIKEEEEELRIEGEEEEERRIIGEEEELRVEGEEEEERRIKGEEEELRMEGEEEEERRIKGEEEQLWMEGEEEQRRIEGEEEEERRIKGEEEQLRMEEEEEQRRIEGEEEEERRIKGEEELQELRIEGEEELQELRIEEGGLRIEEEEELRIEGEEDPHMGFAQSLVPYLAQVPDRHQASLRMALTNLVFCYIENSQGLLPTVSPRLRRYISPQDDPSP